MASNQLSVTEINTPDLMTDRDSRAGNRTHNEASRAQIASSDGHRGPRRPSMNFQASQQSRYPVPIENGHAWSGERSVVRADRERRVSIQHEHDHRGVRDESSHGTYQARFTSENIHRHNHQHDHYHYSQHYRSEERRTREFRGVGSATTRESWEDDDQGFIVPALPMPVAVVCCILNFVVPGLGSMTAGICLLCCGDTADMSCCEKCRSCCTVFGIGLLQLLLVAFFLVGWIWSCIWGITFIGMSAQYDDYDQNYDDEHYNHDQYRGNNPMHHRDRARRQAQQRSRLPTPQVVVDQPYPGVHYDDLPRERLSRQQQSSRRSRSRISLTPSNLIYPMRASSSITYNTPPPPYPSSPPPAYTTQSRSVLPSVREHT
ncbi:hypothetical protein ACF0H5_014530 [Mactra antiquata]